MINFQYVQNQMERYLSGYSKVEKRAINNRILASGKSIMAFYKDFSDAEIWRLIYIHYIVEKTIAKILADEPYSDNTDYGIAFMVDTTELERSRYLKWFESQFPLWSVNWEVIQAPREKCIEAGMQNVPDAPMIECQMFKMIQKDDLNKDYRNN